MSTLLGKVDIWSYGEMYRKIPIDARSIGKNISAVLAFLKGQGFMEKV